MILASTGIPPPAWGSRRSQIDEALYDAFGERPVDQGLQRVRQYFVILEVAAPLPHHARVLNQVYPARPPTGTAVPLSTVAAITNARRPLVVNHHGEFPVGDPVVQSQARRLDRRRRSARCRKVKRDLHMPHDGPGTFQGAAQAFRRPSLGRCILILAALMAVYLVLGMLYESWVHPLTILSTLPSAGLGALLALMLLGMPPWT